MGLYLSDKVKNLTGALAQAKPQVNMREDDQELVCLMHNQKASRPILLNRFSGMVGKLLANDNKMAYEEYVSTWYYDKEFNRIISNDSHLITEYIERKNRECW